MPVLNEERSVQGAIRSALAQGGCDVRVLVVDGRSADRTRELVGELSRTDDRIRLLDNPRVIIPAALNVALHASETEYVARIDGHASVNDSYLQTGVQRLADDPSLAGVGGRRRGVARTRVGRAIAAVMSSPFGVGNSINHYAAEFQITDHASFGVYRADAAREVGGWDEGLAVNEDVDFDHRLREAGYRIAYDPTMIIDWHVRETVGDLFAQYRRYGRGKAQMVRKNGRTAVRLRHLAPPVLVAGTVVIVVASVALSPWFLLALATYALGVAAVGLLTWWQHPERAQTSLLAMPAAFAATHFGWGLGFLEGLLLGRTPAVASGSSRTSAPAAVPTDRVGSPPRRPGGQAA
jgi:cellulose synthase/poly-beta-1,6-N-acetylglucosamine synthase-like glycosyltransferase